MSKRLSSKPTVYIIDGSNFVMRFGEKPYNISEEEFTVWLSIARQTDVLANSEFRVVFDGPCRRSDPAGPGIIVYYTDSEPADNYIAETGFFLTKARRRAVVVSSDNGLLERVIADNVLTLRCEAFLKLVQMEIDKNTR
ncbi:MAG: NYN domain-containing protein [Elusimicrobiales bacterium]|nr:NYN domain-containing protein [Elusimicrobiales bacterium]